MAANRLTRTWAAAMLAATGGSALAEEPGAQGLPSGFHDRTPLQVEIEPMLWFAGFLGDISFKGGSTFDLDQINLDEVHAAPAGRFTLRSRRWTFDFTAFGTSFDDEARAHQDIDAGSFQVSEGDRVAFDISYASFKGTAGWSFDPFILDDSGDTAVWAGVYGGAHVYHLDFEFGTADGADSLEESDTWIEPLVGARLTIELPHGFEIGVSADVGATLGPGTGFAWEIMPTFRWFPMDNKTVAAEIGFRHVQADLSTGSDDDFSFDAATAGLFASVVIRF